MTLCTAAHHASLSIINSQILLKLISIELVMPSNHPMPGFPALHYLLKPAQTHVHLISDAIQPSHLLSSPSTPAFNFPQHEGLFNESVLLIRWPNYWSFSFSISPSNGHSRMISFRMDWLDLLAVQETSRVFSNTTL